MERPDEEEQDLACQIHEAIRGGMTPEAALAAARQRDAEALAEYGWYAHLVFDDDDSPTRYNIHTHGLAERYGHPDFQVVLPLAPGIAHGVLIALADGVVKDGRRFTAGTPVAEIIRGFDVGFAEASECGRPVLRVILPDPDGRLERGEIGAEYAVQYEGTS